MVDPTYQQHVLKIEQRTFNAGWKRSALHTEIRPHLSAEGNWQLIQAGAVIAVTFLLD
jgi:hypothetical protein